MATNVTATAITANATDDVTPFTTNQIVVLGILAGLTSLVTIAGNLVVLFSFILEPAIRHPTNYFIASLAVSDLIIGCVSMPFYTIYQLAGQHWSLGETICDLWLSIDYTVCLSSIYTIFCITVDRFCSVKIPTKYRHWRTERKVLAIILSIWIVPIGVFFTTIFGWQYFVGARTVPVDNCYVQYMDSSVFNAVLQTGYFWTTLVVMCALYVGIYRVALHLQRKSDLKRGRLSSQALEVAADASGTLEMGARSVKLRGPGTTEGRTSCLTTGGTCYSTDTVLNGGRSTQADVLNSIDARKLEDEKTSTDFSSDTDPSCPGISKQGSGRSSGKSRTSRPPRTAERIAVTSCSTQHNVMTNANLGLISDDAVANQLSGYFATELPSNRIVKIVDWLDDPPRGTRGTMAAATDLWNSSSFCSDVPHTAANEDRRNTEEDRPFWDNSPVWVRRYEDREIEAKGSGDTEVVGRHPNGNKCGGRRSRTAEEQFDGSGHRSASRLDCGSSERPAPSDAGRLSNRHSSDDRSKAVDALLLGMVVHWFRQIRWNLGEAVNRRRNLGKTGGKREGRARKALRTITIILGAFVLCWTPWHVLSLIIGFCPNCNLTVLYDVSYWLCYLNSPINPFCYAFANKQFKKTFVRIIRLDWHKA